MKNFDINYSEEIINDIKEKISTFNWSKLPDFNNWDLGINKQVLRDICSYWVSKYNWKKEQEKLNSLNHFTSNIDDLNIHYVYEKGKSSNAIPLLIKLKSPNCKCSSFVQASRLFLANFVLKYKNPLSSFFDC